ncbi:unnamed protein product [Arctia plantaginis]|uniref:Uncharacterized protein n=1 Tax=Arctia plantaginis TaxID=874455 RepID=A0A8S1B8V7_ARCPL|nr:unnamed protein product [Arctia plantaginis]
MRSKCNGLYDYKMSNSGQCIYEFFSYTVASRISATDRCRRRRHLDRVIKFISVVVPDWQPVIRSSM